MNNLVGKKEYLKQQKSLDERLSKKLKENHDKFLPGMEYVKRWNYTVDKSETVPYVNINYEDKPYKSATQRLMKTAIKLGSKMSEPNCG